jgi:hypothetical protein
MMLLVTTMVEVNSAECKQKYKPLTWSSLLICETQRPAKAGKSNLTECSEPPIDHNVMYVG